MPPAILCQLGLRGGNPILAIFIERQQCFAVRISKRTLEMCPHHFMVLFRVQRHNSRSDLTVLVARDDGHLWFFLVRKFVVVQREKHVGESLSICWMMSAWNYHEQGHPFA